MNHQRARPFASMIVIASCAVAIGCGSSKPVGLGAAGGAGGGAAGDGGGGGADAGAAGATGSTTRSAGCDVPPTQTLARYVKYDEVVPNVGAAYAATYTNRVYYVRLPKTYDPERAYPTVFLGPGCGDSGETPIPLEKASGEDAILVGLNGVNNCFNKDAADSPELPYFDETVKQGGGAFAVDKPPSFVAGFSSGRWLTNSPGCAPAGVLRAKASVAGGLPPIPPACAGPIPAMYAA